jgi:hypothetical protein
MVRHDASPGGAGVVDVRLVDLEVIKRYSLAVRRDTVPAAELLEALDASRALVAALLDVNAGPGAATNPGADADPDVGSDPGVGSDAGEPATPPNGPPHEGL